jgi:hypothetical protein
MQSPKLIIFFAKVLSCLYCEKICYYDEAIMRSPSCLGHLGLRNTNRNDSICVALNKKRKEKKKLTLSRLALLAGT